MERSCSSIPARPGLLVTILFFLLEGCTSASGITSFGIQESNDRSLQGLAETVRINNCEGEMTVAQNIEHFHEISVSDASSDQSPQKLIDAVAAHYADDFGASRDISLTVPPKTRKEFVIAWMYETHRGIIVDRENRQLASYSIRIAFGVGVVYSADLGC